LRVKTNFVGAGRRNGYKQKTSKGSNLEKRVRKQGGGGTIGPGKKLRRGPN